MLKYSSHFAFLPCKLYYIRDDKYLIFNKWAWLRYVTKVTAPDGSSICVE